MESYIFKPFLYKVKSFFRFQSNVSTPDRKLYRPTYIVEELLNKGNSTTSVVINSVLLNQKVYINLKELDELLNLPSVKFDLPITNETYPALLALVGKPASRRSNAGVYIFYIQFSYIVNMQVQVMIYLEDLNNLFIKIPCLIIKILVICYLGQKNKNKNQKHLLLRLQLYLALIRNFVIAYQSDIIYYKRGLI